MPAIGKPFELHEIGRQRRCDIRLALDRMHRVVLAAKHEGGALDAMKLWLSPAGLANQCSATSGFPTVRLPMFGSRGVRI